MKKLMMISVVFAVAGAQMCRGTDLTPTVPVNQSAEKVVKKEKKGFLSEETKKLLEVCNIKDDAQFLSSFKDALTNVNSSVRIYTDPSKPDFFITVKAHLIMRACKIKDDAQFAVAFKDAVKYAGADEAVPNVVFLFPRACEMKDDAKFVIALKDAVKYVDASDRVRYMFRRVCEIKDDVQFFVAFKDALTNVEWSARIQAKSTVVTVGNLIIWGVCDIKDDSRFLAVFKDVAKYADASEKEGCLIPRALKMKDAKLLAEFFALCPDQLEQLVDKKKNPSKIKMSPQLAEVILDNLKGLPLKGDFSFAWGSTYGLTDWVFEAAKALDAAARAKYIKIADDNLAAAKQDEDILVVERYYVGMPVIDFVMRAFEEKHAWIKWKDPVDYLVGYADLKTEVALDKWKQEWKIKTLVFPSKERAKIFKVKGTLEGFVDFLKKYVDKAATVNDVTIENDWWIYLDDPHGLKISLKDTNGALNIYRQ